MADEHHLWPITSISGDDYSPLLSCAFGLSEKCGDKIWLPVLALGQFTNITTGNYAVSVAHDENTNKKVDTNFVGMPTEAWGVSNNIRPLMRAPRWHEAQFTLATGEKKTIKMQLEK